MSDKIEFPTGVELPLRGGGVAVLYEFFEGDWFGRFRRYPDHSWIANHWFGDGTMDGESDLNILPPKRKAWVVWVDGAPMGVFRDSLEAHKYSIRTFGISNKGPNAVLQEITEP